MRIKKKPSSLKVRLLILVALCWIIPVVVLGGYCYFYYVQSVNDKILNSMSNEIRFAASMAAENIDSVIKVSREVTYDGMVDRYYKRYLKDDDIALLNQSINKYLHICSSSDPLINFCALYLLDEPDLLFYYSKYGGDAVNDFKENAKMKVDQFVTDLDSRIGFLVSNDRVYIVRNLTGYIYGKGYGTYGIIVFELNTQEAFQNLQNNDLWSGSMNYSINDCIGKIDSKAEIKLNLADLAQKGSQIVKENGVYVFSGSIGKDDFTFGYRTEISVGFLNEEIESYIWLMILLTIVILPVLLTTLAFFYKNFTNPLQSLVEAGQHLENQNFGYQIEIKEVNSEFAYLIKTFNEMSEQLKNLFQKVYKEEIAVRDSRIMALQAQINPHFLNNTLELMNWQARFSGDIVVSKMIESLSILMDAALDRSGRRVTPLSEELKCADAYLYIINQRFGERLTVDKEIDADLLDFKVPPLIIQPLLENAVEHGIESVTKGHIDIHVYKKGDQMNIDIINDGARLKPEDLRRIDILLNSPDGANTKSSTSLGIRNVNDRLKLIYGENSGLHIFPNKTGDTLSKVVIPITETEQ